MRKLLLFFISFFSIFFLSCCGFHLQGEQPLPPHLKRLHIDTPDPYGQLTRSLQQYLKMSEVTLVANKADADSVLVIEKDQATQVFLSVNGTQQTRQYNLVITVNFAITDKNGNVIVPSQTLSESKPITVQSNQILGSNNETTQYYQQMHRTLAYAIINRLASKEISQLISHHFAIKKKP